MAKKKRAAKKSAARKPAKKRATKKKAAKKPAKKTAKKAAKKNSRARGSRLNLVEKKYRAYCHTQKKWISRGWHDVRKDAVDDAQPCLDKGHQTEIFVQVSA